MVNPSHFQYVLEVPIRRKRLTAKGRGRKSQRTRGHIIADLSFNYLERRVLLRGHALARVIPDYGIDAVMFTYSDSGEIENGDIRFQLKATDHLVTLRDGKTITFTLETGHVRYWANEPMPVVLVLYDAQRDKAYWLDMHEYIEDHHETLDPDKQTTSIRICVSNRLDVRAVDKFRTARDHRLSRFSWKGTN